MANKKHGGYGVNLTSGGTPFLIGFIAIAVGFALLFTRGVAPSSTLTSPGNQSEYEIVPETPVPGQGLQLKKLNFQACANTLTMDLLLDKSGSMSDPTPSGVSKMSRLKQAISSLIQNAQDGSIIGIQSFSSPALGVNDLRNDVPISFYKDIKGIIPGKLSALQPSGATPTHDALDFSYNLLKSAVADPRFKDRKFNFILVSDGAPCPGIGCVGNPGADQDPRKYNPNPADEIKALGINVYTLGIFSAQDTDTAALADLLKSIASSPSDYYAAQSGDEIPQLLTQISTKICNATSSN